MKNNPISRTLISIIVVLLWSVRITFAQNVGINTSGATPKASALLDLNTGNTFTSPNGKGLLIPNVALSSSIDATTINTPAYSLLVYNTGTNAGFPTPGYYYNANPVVGSATWTALGGGSSTGWLTTGNAGTTPGTNFLGTTDAQNFMIKTDNTERVLLNGGYPDTTQLFIIRGNGQLDNAPMMQFQDAHGNDLMDINSDTNVNVFIGYQAGRNNVLSGSFPYSGINNTFVGASCGLLNISGNYNTAIGGWALRNSTNNNNNTAVGFYALVDNGGNDNTAVGYQSLFSNSGSLCTAVGYNSLFYNNGAFNTAYGAFAMQGASTGSGSWNTAVGSSALGVNGTGSSNTGIGFEALELNTKGSKNTALGDSALYNNTTGKFNTAVGYAALSNITTGSSNTALGYQAGTSTAALSNTTAIGNGASATASNTIVLGNTAITTLYCQVTTITTLSDGRFKTNVCANNIHGLDFIMKLRPVSYNLNIRKLNAFKGFKDEDDKSIDQAQEVLHNGFIAQEVEKAANETGYKFSGLTKPKNDSDTYALGYTDFVVPLVKAVQEQQHTIDSVKGQLNAMLKALADDQKEIQELKNLVKLEVSAKSEAKE